MTKGIRAIPSVKIDKEKWDACLNEHSNGMIYANSLYLDTMSANWEGLVAGDYEAIFPIPYKRKWGLKYAYPPPFTQQLGFVGDVDLYPKMLDRLANHIQYGDFLLNYENNPKCLKGATKLCNNLILQLKDGIDNLQSQYSTLAKRNIAKAKLQGLSYSKSEDLTLIIQLHKDYTQYKMPHVTDKDYQNLHTLCQKFLSSGKALIRNVWDKTGNVQSACLLLKDEKRYYNLLNTTVEVGRQNGANYFLFHNMFTEFSNQPYLFDFEGSDIEGVKQFYEKFGGINQPYICWHHNSLMFPLNLIKK